VSIVGRLRAVWTRRRILGTLVRRDLRVRYARSVLGYVWTLIDPLAMALVYYLVFAVIFNRTEVLGLPFIVFLLCGLLPWNWFNNSINETARSLYAERLLVRSTNLPRELWVIRVVVAKGIEHLLSLPILVMFVVIYSVHGAVHPNWRVVYLLPALLIEFLLLIGMGLVMAPVTALVDDFQRVVRIGLRVLFYMTPVIYELDLVAKKSPNLLRVLQFNPLSGIIDLYRIGLVGVAPNWTAIGLSAVVSVLWLVFGLWVFARLERAVLKEI
jgi:ABC-2 type transport system permease protein